RCLRPICPSLLSASGPTCTFPPSCPTPNFHHSASPGRLRGAGPKGERFTLRCAHFCETIYRSSPVACTGLCRAFASLRCNPHRQGSVCCRSAPVDQPVPRAERVVARGLEPECGQC